MRPSHRQRRSAGLFNNNYCCLFHYGQIYTMNLPENQHICVRHIL